MTEISDERCGNTPAISLTDLEIIHTVVAIALKLTISTFTFVVSSLLHPTDSESPYCTISLGRVFISAACSVQRLLGRGLFFLLTGDVLDCLGRLCFDKVLRLRRHRFWL
ncbi:Uncharacterised protein [Mycobacteroides abscessus subsp. massiliense]|nr:Uncharacterised protein [Mycobacteroides abscessus subsp. massiliense]